MSHPAESREALLAFIASDPALRDLLAEARARDEAPGAPRDPAHDAEHLLRVAGNTLRCDPSLDPRLVVAAALLHDAVRLAKSHPQRSRSGALAAEQARARLGSLGFRPAEVEEAAEAIRDHGFSRGVEPAGALARALQDGDRLDALGAHGLYRVIATGLGMGADLYQPDDPWAARRALDETRHSVDHFFTKLLGLPATMRTAGGRAEAARRVAILREFLRALGDEIGAPPPEESPRPAPR